MHIFYFVTAYYCWNRVRRTWHWPELHKILSVFVCRRMGTWTCRRWIFINLFLDVLFWWWTLLCPPPPPPIPLFPISNTHINPFRAPWLPLGLLYCKVELHLLLSTPCPSLANKQEHPLTISADMTKYTLSVVRIMQLTVNWAWKFLYNFFWKFHCNLFSY